MLRWHPGPLSFDPSYELHEVLLDADDDGITCFAMLESFASYPQIIYGTARRRDGNVLRSGPCNDLVVVKDWCERIVGMKADRPIDPKRPIA